MTLDTKELRRLVDAMTPGEWGNAGYPLRGIDGPEVHGPGDVLLLTMECRPNDDNDAQGICALRNAAPALIYAAEEVERLRAFVPVWVRVIGAWELRACGVRVGWIEWAGRDHIARVDVGRGGWKAAGTHPDLPTAARAVCDALGVPYVAVGEVAGE